MNCDFKNFKSKITLHVNGEDVEFDLDAICSIDEANIENELKTLPKYYTFFSSLLIDADNRRKKYAKELQAYEATAKKILREKLIEASTSRVTDAQTNDALNRNPDIIKKREILVALEFEVDKCKNILRSLEMKDRSIKHLLNYRSQELQMYHYRKAMKNLDSEGMQINPKMFEQYKQSIKDEGEKNGH